MRRIPQNPVPPDGATIRWEWFGLLTSRNRDAPACSRTGNIGKVADFDSAMRRFESSRPSHAPP
jgi:hypothetical protein